MVTIQIDDGLMLRVLDISDANVLFRLFEENRLHLTEWQDWPNKIQTVKDCEQYINQHIQDNRDGKSLTLLMIADGNIVGMCWLSKIVPPLRKAFLSYWIAESHQGHGIVTRSCQALMAYGFETMNLNRLALQYKQVSEDHANTRSWRVAERLGFIREGILRQDGMTKGVLMDMVICAILADEWQATQSDA